MHGGYTFYQGLDVAPNGRVDVGWQEQVTASAWTFGTGNASIDAYHAHSSDGGASWSSPVKVSSSSSDPAESAQNNLERQFWGDYNALVSTNAQAWFTCTDSRHGVGCAAVDNYQRGVRVKPAPQNDCPAQFGNTDVYVSKITPQIGGRGAAEVPLPPPQGRYTIQVPARTVSSATENVGLYVPDARPAQAVRRPLTSGRAL